MFPAEPYKARLQRFGMLLPAALTKTSGPTGEGKQNVGTRRKEGFKDRKVRPLREQTGMKDKD